MNLKIDIYPVSWRKALSIFLAVFLGIGFSFGGALASGCQEGADCLVCAELLHGHSPDAMADMENPGCPSGGQENACGFEASQSPDEFQGIVSTARLYHQADAGIFAAVLDEYGQALLPKEFVPQFLLSDSSATAPIYLLNQALIC